MNLKSLKIFCDIVSRRSFSRAAEENGISQSGASQVVSQLEGRLGVQLIERSKRPLVPTAEGRVFFDGCRKIVARYDALEDEVRSLHDDVAGRVRVAAIYSVGLHHMSAYVQEFMSRHPKANVRLEYLHPERVVEAIRNDQADVGIISYPRGTRAIEAEAWREEPIVLVCSPHHPFAGRAAASLRDLHGQRLVGFDPDLVIRHEMDRAIEAEAAEPTVVMEFDNIETIKRAVEIDTGMALLPEPTVVREVAAGSLVSLPLEGVTLGRPLGIIRSRGKPLAPTVRRFIELLRGHAHDTEAASLPLKRPPRAADLAVVGTA
jgi:DNA-binding transcriptional LysR family regulator